MRDHNLLTIPRGVNLRSQIPLADYMHLFVESTTRLLSCQDSALNPVGTHVDGWRVAGARTADAQSLNC